MKMVTLPFGMTSDNKQRFTHLPMMWPTRAAQPPGRTSVSLLINPPTHPHHHQGDHCQLTTPLTASTHSTAAALGPPLAPPALPRTLEILHFHNNCRGMPFPTIVNTNTSTRDPSAAHTGAQTAHPFLKSSVAPMNPPKPPLPPDPTKR